MSVEPKIFIDYNSRDADSLETAYSKYNSHYHSEATKLNFYTYNIYPDDIVSMYTSLLVPVFTGECKVDSFTDAGLVLSKTANVTVIDGSVTIAGTVYNNVSITIGTNLLTLEPKNGVVNPITAQFSQLVTLRGSLNYKLSGKVFLSLDKPYQLRLTKLKYYARSTTIAQPTGLNLIKSGVSNATVSYIPSTTILTDSLQVIILPLDDIKYILDPTDTLYIEISNGLSNYAAAINAASVPLLDYEVEGYIIS
jgi:hypothetical protein